MSKLPFSIERNSRISYTEQLADALKRAIDSGAFREGETLPTLDELSKLTGVSLMVVRAAIRRLVKEGFVNPRPGIGSIVLGRRDRLWHGRVLLVTTEFRDNYMIGTMVGILREELMRAGYLPWQVSVVKNAKGSPDFAQIDLVLREKFSIAVSFRDSLGIERHLRASRIPYVVLGGKGRNHIVFDRHAALPDFIAHCRSSGLRKVLCPVFEGGCDTFVDTLAAAGLKAALWRLPYAADLTRGDKVQFGTYEAFRDRLRAGRDWLPEVLYFDDDYAVVGALLALDEAHVRVPEDVKIVAWRVVGNGPCYTKTLTRLETDAEMSGRAFAKYILALLEGRHPDAAMAAIRSTYVIGETFPAENPDKRI